MLVLFLLFVFGLGLLVVPVFPLFPVFVFFSSTVTVIDPLDIELSFVEISTLFTANVPLPSAFDLKVNVTLPKSASSA